MSGYKENNWHCLLLDFDQCSLQKGLSVGLDSHEGKNDLLSGLSHLDEVEEEASLYFLA